MQHFVQILRHDTDVVILVTGLLVLLSLLPAVPAKVNRSLRQGWQKPLFLPQPTRVFGGFFMGFWGVLSFFFYLFFFSDCSDSFRIFQFFFNEEILTKFLLLSAVFFNLLPPGPHIELTHPSLIKVSPWLNELFDIFSRISGTWTIFQLKSKKNGL